MTVCLSPNGSNVAASSHPADELLIATVDGVVRLRAGHDSWQVAGRHLEGLHISSLLLEPINGALFAGVHGEGLYFSADGGQTWEARVNGLTHKHVFSLASTKRGDQVVVFAGTEPAHLFETIDYGQTWTELPGLRQVPDTDRWTFPAPPHVGHVKALAFDPRDDQVLYVAIEQGALLKSTDAGKTFHELGSFAQPDDHAYKDVHRLVVQPARPDDLFMPSGIGLYASHNAGETWQRITTRQSRIGYPDQFLISPLNDQVMFMAGSAGSPGSWRTSHHADSTIMRSNDGGQSWQVAARGLPENMRDNIEAMGVGSYPDGFTLFAATTGGDVFASDDQATTWRQIAGGLPPISKVGHFKPLQATAA